MVSDSLVEAWILRAGPGSVLYQGILVFFMKFVIELVWMEPLKKLASAATVLKFEDGWMG